MSYVSRMLGVMPICLAAATAGADVSVSNLFDDHMVLQRGMAVPVWGKAEPGETVTVTFHGKQVSGEADDAGRWMMKLPVMSASAEGQVMTIAGQNTIQIKDVLVGEVWVCSGQSNMQYGWGKQSHPMFNWGGDVDIAALADKAKGKPIRSFDVRPNVAFEPIDEVNGTWATGPSGSAVAFGFSYDLYEALDVPVAVIVTCWGSSSIEGWMPRDLAEQLPHFRALLDQFDGSDPARARVQAAIDRGVRYGFTFVRKQVNLLYNAMMHPLIPYACRGMVWYQGEANAKEPRLYAKSLPAWIKRMRQGWNEPNMHFLAVMLPGYGSDDGTPTAKSWAWFREAQMRSLALPHTGVANTIDLGDVKNIHPPDKAPICERLSLLARRDVYGQDVVAQGPTFKRYTTKNSVMIIHFDHATGLKTTDGNPPTGFWLAGEDQQWHRATAQIKDEMVLLSTPDVAAPVACRYAWSGKPAVNLVNKADLPAYPFRSDNWEQ